MRIVRFEYYFNNYKNVRFVIFLFFAIVMISTGSVKFFPIHIDRFVFSMIL